VKVEATMSAPAEKVLWTPDNSTRFTRDTTSDRRADIELKQEEMAAVLREVECEGLLILDPDNFAWLTSGGAARSGLDPSELPALYFGPEQRWLLASNADSQRLFDEEINGLGFQLKEWPWDLGREQLLANVCRERKLACDTSFGACKPVGDLLRKRRRTLTAYEQACYRMLGRNLSHAVEATCRTMVVDQTEREVAGQLAHRLMHRGIQPIVISVAADGRSRVYRQGGFTGAPIKRYCVVTVTARKYGLCATVSRSVSFGRPDDTFRQESDAACKISVAYAASTWPDAVPREILTQARRVYAISGFEHEWRHCSQGHVTGRSPVEMTILPKTEELLQAGWGITWRASVGAASSCDTYLIAEKGPEIITPPEAWPLSRIRFQGADFFRPYFLER
jgi:Xaa-Pro aminopeptidase